METPAASYEELSRCPVWRALGKLSRTACTNSVCIDLNGGSKELDDGPICPLDADGSIRDAIPKQNTRGDFTGLGLTRDMRRLVKQALDEHYAEVMRRGDEPPDWLQYYSQPETK